MNQPRSLVPARDTCGRATPSRIVQRVAGMAFNFSTLQLPGRTSKALEIALHCDTHRISVRSCDRRDLHNRQLAMML